ncbi:DNA-binding HxlR family transcriptional regulator [Paenibacillus sp. PvR052]|nr:DNA-binding HxlR family transcriptional regulator [Paenibacillus sp. PvP091]MBP1169029.1 DNA-binding HxlR family transcriptional regulator [Paenibacillus sp. PvR098]MBP2440057.1 DNA-binding HxlR family transcriptional regulator [Paenibacillus sp. PvP052]
MYCAKSQTKFEKAMAIISTRWCVLIVYQLLLGPRRFSEIESAIHISSRLLTERLKYLEHEGIVKHDWMRYSLTKKGLAMEDTIRNIENWAIN